MKTLRQYEKQLAFEDLSFDNEMITEGWLRDLIKGGISLYAKMFKYADTKHKEFLKKRALNKDLQKLETCKTREWWDNYFKGTDWEKKWFEINPLDKKQANKKEENSENNQTPANEAKQEKNPTTLEEMFTEDKFVQYTESGMTELIINGFCMMYDLAKTHENKQVMTIAVKFMKSILKMNDKAVDNDNKKTLQKVLKDQEEALKKNDEGGDKNNQSELSPEEKKQVTNDTSKIAKTVGVSGDSDNIQKAVSPIITTQESLNESEEQILEKATKLKDMPEELQNFKKSFFYKSGALSKNPDALETNRQCIILFATAVDGILSKMVDTKGKSASNNKDLILKALSQMVELEEFKKYLGK